MQEFKKGGVAAFFVEKEGGRGGKEGKGS